MFERIAPERHDTLDGIPEPAENPVFFGHDEARAMLAGTLRAGKLPHALIFAGAQGVGKATTAFHLANLLLQNVDPRSVATIPPPDPASTIFRQIAVGAHPSVLHLTRPFDERNKRFKTVISVDEIRKVNQFLSLTAHAGGWRVVIVDPADDMNVNAANALLKNLEEPPAKTVFVLIAHSPGKLLPTIRSRAQIVRFAPLNETELRAALDRLEGVEAGEGRSFEALVQRAGGSVRAAILLTQYGGLEITDTLDQLAAASRVDVALAHKLADAVNGRDRAIPFRMFNERALQLLSEAASTAAASGDLGRADRLASAWQKARATITDAETYNLDPKLHALVLIDRLNAALGAASS